MFNAENFAQLWDSHNYGTELSDKSNKVNTEISISRMKSTTTNCGIEIHYAMLWEVASRSMQINMICKTASSLILSRVSYRITGINSQSLKVARWKFEDFGNNAFYSRVRVAETCRLRIRALEVTLSSAVIYQRNLWYEYLKWHLREYIYTPSCALFINWIKRNKMHT